VDIQVIRENALNINRGMYVAWMGNTLSDANATALLASGAAVSIVSQPYSSDIPIPISSAGFAAIQAAGTPSDAGLQYKVNDVTPNIIYFWNGTTYAALGSGGGGEVPAYTGQVATRCYYPRNKDATNTQGMYRSFHIARDAITSLKVEFPNVMGVNGTTTPSGSGQDVGSGGAMNITASVEYPAGTFTQLKFSGVAQGSIPDVSLLQSDALAVTIPKNARFWIRSYVVCQGSGRLLTFLTTTSNNNQNVLGEAANYGTTGITDLTLGGNISNTVAGGNIYMPTRILGNTAKRSFLGFGDSKMAALSTLGNKDQSGDVGEIFPSIGKTHAYTSLAVGGDLVTQMTANSTVRKTFIGSNFTDVILQAGINDITNGVSAADLLTATNVLANLAIAAGLRVWKCTIAPSATSSDSFATYANQTVAANEAVRTAYNDLIRNEVRTDNGGYIDIADIMEVGPSGFPKRNSGRWMFGGTGDPNAFTFDGLHESSQGNKVIERTGNIRATLGL